MMRHYIILSAGVVLFNTNGVYYDHFHSSKEGVLYFPAGLLSLCKGSILWEKINNWTLEKGDVFCFFF